MRNPWRIETYGSYWTHGTLLRIWGTVVAVLIAACVLGGWAWSTWWEDHKSARGRGDTFVAEVDHDPADAIEMPDTFGNVATKCSHGKRLWVTTNGGIFVTDDPTCASTQASA